MFSPGPSYFGLSKSGILDVLAKIRESRDIVERPVNTLYGQKIAERRE
jgi:hypothetical protein